MSLIQCLKKGYEEFKKERDYQRRKQKLLDKNMDYSFLEELVQKMNENPLLSISIKLTDGTLINLNTIPKRKQFEDMVQPYESHMEIR